MATNIPEESIQHSEHGESLKSGFPEELAASVFRQLTLHTEEKSCSEVSNYSPTEMR